MRMIPPPEVDEYTQYDFDDDTSYKRHIVNNPSKRILRMIFEDEASFYSRRLRHLTIGMEFMAKEYEKEYIHEIVNKKYLKPNSHDYIDDDLRPGVPPEIIEALREVDAEAFKMIGRHIIRDFDDGKKPERDPFDVFYERWKQLHPETPED